MAIVDVIKYEGDNKTFVWKHPREDFNTMSQLIVHESQEALFFMNGQAMDLFGPGRYTLETQNIPILGAALKLVTGGKSAFHCEVYYVNKTEQMAMKWGTDSKVQYIDPEYRFPISIGVSGEMSLKVQDSRKFLVKLIGTEAILGQPQMIIFFRAFLMTKVKSYIAQYMRQNSVSIFEIDEHLMEFSDAMREQLMPDFSDYGIRLERFFVTNIVKPDGEKQYEQFKDLHFRQYADIAEAKLRRETDLIVADTEAQKTIIASKAMATKRAQEGYTYQQERGFDVARDAAQNEAIGQFTNLGVGFGTMAGVGGVVGGMMSESLGSAVNQVQAQNVTAVSQGASAGSAFCENCGAELVPGSAFCDECGAAVQADNKVCRNCGYEFERPGKFCPKCGTRRE